MAELRDPEEVSAAFERALNKSLEAKKAGEDYRYEYLRAVADALGWALDEYDDDPTE